MRRTFVVLGLLAVAAVYAATGANHVLGGDHGEFATIAAGGGLAHPPGYPVYSMYLRMAGASIRASSWLQIPWMLLAVALVFAVARRAGGSVLASGAAAVWFALTPLAWTQATHAEVFALHAALAAAVVWASEWAGRWRWLLLGALFGLGAAHHHTLIFLLPLLFNAIGWGRSPPKPPPRVGQFCAAFAVASAPIWFVGWLARDGAWAWGDASSPHYVWDLLLRRDYGSLSLSALATQSSVSERLVFFTRASVLGSGGLMLVGLVGAVKRAQWPWWISWVLAGPVMAMLLTISLQGTGIQVAKRFLLLPLVLAAPYAALALDRLRSVQMRAAAAALAIAATTWLGWREVRAHSSDLVDQGLIATLRGAPANAIVLGSGDHRLFGFLYLQKIEHERPDVTYVHMGLLADAWYRERLLIEIDPARLKEQVNEWLAAGRPVLVLDAGILAVLDVSTYPQGTWLRAVPRGTDLPTPVALESLNLTWTSHYDLDGPLSDDPTTWAAAVQDDYARPYLALARVFEKQGDKAAAARNLARVKRYAPWFEP